MAFDTCLLLACRLWGQAQRVQLLRVQILPAALSRLDRERLPLLLSVICFTSLPGVRPRSLIHLSAGLVVFRTARTWPCLCHLPSPLGLAGSQLGLLVSPCFWHGNLSITAWTAWAVFALTPPKKVMGEKQNKKKETSHIGLRDIVMPILWHTAPKLCVSTGQRLRKRWETLLFLTPGSGLDILQSGCLAPLLLALLPRISSSQIPLASPEAYGTGQRQGSQVALCAASGQFWKTIPEVAAETAAQKVLWCQVRLQLVIYRF